MERERDAQRKTLEVWAAWRAWRERSLVERGRERKEERERGRRRVCCRERGKEGGGQRETLEIWAASRAWRERSVLRRSTPYAEVPAPPRSSASYTVRLTISCPKWAASSATTHRTASSRSLAT